MSVRISVESLSGCAWNGCPSQRGIRSRLKNELEVARKEGMEAKKAKQASRSFLFFIGNQDAKKPALFHVQDHRLICTLHDELVFPAYSRTARR